MSEKKMRVLPVAGLVGCGQPEREPDCHPRNTDDDEPNKPSISEGLVRMGKNNTTRKEKGIVLTLIVTSLIALSRPEVDAADAPARDVEQKSDGGPDDGESAVSDLGSGNPRFDAFCEKLQKEDPSEYQRIMEAWDRDHQVTGPMYEEDGRECFSVPLKGGGGTFTFVYTGKTKHFVPIRKSRSPGLLGIAVLFALLFGAITAWAAATKGRNALGWFFVGFFLQLVGLIIVLVVSNLTEEKRKWAEAERERRRLQDEVGELRSRLDADNGPSQTNAD